MAKLKINGQDKIYLGNDCVHCRKDTSFGSGRYVNRYPAEIYSEEEDAVLEGYCCDVCEQEYIDSLDEEEKARYLGDGE
jgi:hypothetical protein